jgi:hypothetical protein
MNLFNRFCLAVLIILCNNLNAQTPNHYIVTSIVDQGIPFPPFQQGTLRWAIAESNTNPGLDYIDFNIIGGTLPYTITLLSDLPVIRGSVMLDGNTQPGFIGTHKKIKIKGASTCLMIGDYLLNQYTTTEILNIEFDGGSFTPVIIANNAAVKFTKNIVYRKTGPSMFLLMDIRSDNNIFNDNIFGTDDTFSTANNFGCGGVRIVGSNNFFGGLLANEKNYVYNTFSNPYGETGVHSLFNAQKNRISGNIFINNPKNINLYYNPYCGNICKLPPVYSISVTGSTIVMNGTSFSNDFIEIYKSNAGGIDALQLLGTVSANSAGVFSINLNGVAIGDKIIATGTDSQNNTSEFGPPQTIISCPTVIGANYQVNPCLARATSNDCQGKCKSIEGSLILSNSGSSTYSVIMNYGDGTASNTITTTSNPNNITNNVGFVHPYNNGTYTVTATINGPGTCISTYTFVVNIICTPPPCSDCIGSFAPIPDSTYIISAWVKETGATINTTTYSNSKINISFRTGLTSSPGSSPIGTPVLAMPTGLIIDGWQKIEQKFKIPAGAAALKIDLQSTVDANFDDIRVFPFNGSMKSYVYDPTTMRLMAELDERNYATFYEYDEEGKLIRVKKETEKGIMTIKESRNSTPIK